MAKEVTNKSAVVTGGADGIGFQIADHLLQNEAKIVIILDINEQKGVEAEKAFRSKYGDGRAKFIKCDVTQDLEDVSKHILDVYGSIDILVNNAGIVDEKRPRKVMEINVIACIEWTLKFYDTMRTDKGGNGGTILNISSVAGFRSGFYLPCYSASKSAVLTFTKKLGHEENFNKYGVRVIALCPGLTSTNIGSSFYSDNQSDSLNHAETVSALGTIFRQSPEVVGKAAVEVIERAESGTAWISEEGKPIHQLQS